MNQSGCGMKVNTDGVLLGALAQSDKQASVLDIGAGTGVISLMLAQRFSEAQIDAVEIDEQAAQTAQANFKNSKFDKRLKLFSTSFQLFSNAYPEKKYDLIISNPPFFTDSLKNPDKQKQLARHTDVGLFGDLIQFCNQHLQANGVCYLILPLKAAKQVIEEGLKSRLHLQQVISISSSYKKQAHRQIIRLGFTNERLQDESFIIYESEKVYTDEYKNALKDFLTIF